MAKKQRRKSKNRRGKKSKEIITLRPHHFDLLIYIWNPERAKKYWGRDYFSESRRQGYGGKMTRQVSKLSKMIRRGEVKIMPVPSLDSICSFCPKNEQSCANKDSIYSLFRYLKLKYGRIYSSSKIAKKIDEWAKKYPNY